MNFRKTVAATAGALLITAGVASAQPEMNIVETAIDAGTFNTLVAAVQAAGLVETLTGRPVHRLRADR